MGKDSPKDRLLEASGLHNKEMPLEGLRDLQERTNAYFEATVREAENVVARQIKAHHKKDHAQKGM